MPFKHMIIAILVAAIWGCNFIFIKIGIEEIPPILLCAMRFFFASVPAVFFVSWPKAPFKMILLYGIVMYGLHFSLLFSSLFVGMTAGMASLLMQTQIFFSILFAILFLGDRADPSQILGFIVALVGILLVASHLGTNVSLPGFFLVIGAAASWGFGNFITKKINHVNIAALIAWGSLISCPMLFIVSFIIEGQERIIHCLHKFSWLAVIALAYIVYISTWIGYGLWNWLLSRYPVTSVVPFTLLIPIFGILSSVFILGESFERWKLFASALVIAGLCINLIGARFFTKNRKNLLQFSENQR